VKTFLPGIALAICLAIPARAAITVPGANGSDGALNINRNTTIDLSLASAGVWDANSPVAGNGVYDPGKWAVVFHYSGVNISAGTLSFLNHDTRAPVVWLVNGDVNISGAIELRIDANGYQPGPGGFRSGHVSNGADVGFGPGGSLAPGGGGSYASAGAGGTAASLYGNERVLPLIGGSGGSLGSGPGAILIAATGTITINGSIHAEAFYGSGGAIRLIADSLKGTGLIYAYRKSAGGDGRINIETNHTDATLVIAPVPVTGYAPEPVTLWPSASAPSTRIVSIGGIPISTDPHASFNSAADATPNITPGQSLDVVIETKNVVTTSKVNLRVGPLKANGSVIPATLVSGNATSATWKATIPAAAPGTNVVQVRVEAP
jgi:hypothetical protein